MKMFKHVLNKNGFTMMEALLSLLILTTVMVLMPLIFKTFATIDEIIRVDEDYEWNLFLINLRNELIGTEEIRIYNHRIFIDKHNFSTSITYEEYGNSIRRRLNDTGHEVVLQNIEKVTFSQKNNLLIVTVDFLSGVSEEAQFLIPI